MRALAISIAPGVYTIYPDSGTEPPKSASLLTGAFDGSCQPDDADAATAKSGTVTLNTTAAGVFSGTFDVVLNTGGHITGTFDPAACPALQTAVTNTNHSCM
jgi:hypothetical protein